jgi:hypothetical protein
LKSGLALIPLPVIVRTTAGAVLGGVVGCVVGETVDFVVTGAAGLGVVGGASAARGVVWAAVDGGLEVGGLAWCF